MSRTKGVRVRNGPAVVRLRAERAEGIRLERGWSHNDVVERAGIKRLAWWRYRQGHGVSGEARRRLARVFRVSFAELFEVVSR